MASTGSSIHALKSPAGPTGFFPPREFPVNLNELLIPVIFGDMTKQLAQGATQKLISVSLNGKGF